MGILITGCPLYPPLLKHSLLENPPEILRHFPIKTSILEPCFIGWVCGRIGTGNPYTSWIFMVTTMVSNGFLRIFILNGKNHGFRCKMLPNIQPIRWMFDCRRSPLRLVRRQERRLQRDKAKALEAGNIHWIGWLLGNSTPETMVFTCFYHWIDRAFRFQFSRPMTPSHSHGCGSIFKA